MSDDAAPEVSIGARLVGLRDLVTQRTGHIHDAQIYQLERWPRVVIRGLLPGKEGVTLRIKFPEFDGGDNKVSSGVVGFDLLAEVGWEAPPRNLDILARNVAWLLGDDWSCWVKINKKKVFGRTSRHALKS